MKDNYVVVRQNFLINKVNEIHFINLNLPYDMYKLV